MNEIKKMAPVTTALVILNVITFALCVILGNTLFDYGELTVSGVRDSHEYLRLVGAMFLHANFLHLFNNMLVLFLLGQMLEPAVGSLPFAVTYLLSGIGGNLLSLYSKIIHESPIASVGASGAIFGLDGLMLAFLLAFPNVRRRDSSLLTRVLLMIGLSLYNGFTSPGIDNAGHVGGLITGFLAGLVFCLLKRHQLRQQVP